MEENTKINDTIKDKDITTFFEWNAPSRSFKRRDKEYFINLGVLVFFISLIFLFFQEFIVIVTLWVLFGILYVFSTVEPETVTHKITDHGVNFAKYEYKWRDLQSFYFSKKNNINILFLNTKKALPGRVYLILDPKLDLDKIYDTLKTYIEFEEKPVNTWFEKLVEKFSDKFSLE